MKNNFDELERLLLKVRKERNEHVFKLKITHINLNYKASEFKTVDGKINKTNDNQVKMYNYIKMLTEHFATTIEIVNSILALSLKEEEDKGYKSIQ